MCVSVLEKSCQELSGVHPSYATLVVLVYIDQLILLLQLCECDRQFVQCLSEYPCPKTKAMCQSPWRYFQNLFMGLGTGMVRNLALSDIIMCFVPLQEMHSPHQNTIHGPPHRAKPKPPFKYPKPIFRKYRINLQFG